MFKEYFLQARIFALLSLILVGVLIAGCTSPAAEKVIEEDSLAKETTNVEDVTKGILQFSGDLRLNDRHSYESAYDAFNRRFTLENSLNRIKQIDEALTSFRMLTEKSRSYLSEQELSIIGNTMWEAQALGFYNWVAAVEGTMREQEYQIRKLEFELAKEQFEVGKINKEELSQKELSYKKAVEQFQKFWDSFRIMD